MRNYLITQRAKEENNKIIANNTKNIKKKTFKNPLRISYIENYNFSRKPNSR